MLSDAELRSVEVLFGRYKALILENMALFTDLPGKCSGPHLVRLCAEALENAPKYPFDKLSRWLGFVQGVLAAIGLIDVDAEREFSRPYLHAIHAEAFIPTFSG